MNKSVFSWNKLYCLLKLSDSFLFQEVIWLTYNAQIYFISLFFPWRNMVNLRSNILHFSICFQEDIWLTYALTSFIFLFLPARDLVNLRSNILSIYLGRDLAGSHFSSTCRCIWRSFCRLRPLQFIRKRTRSSSVVTISQQPTRYALLTKIRVQLEHGLDLSRESFYW